MRSDAWQYIEYEHDLYTQLYRYPTKDSDVFNFCFGLIDDNAIYPYSNTETSRQWRVHTCFRACRDSTDELNFGDTSRISCTEPINKDLWCVVPEDNCEQ